MNQDAARRKVKNLKKKAKGKSSKRKENTQTYHWNGKMYVQYTQFSHFHILYAILLLLNNFGTHTYNNEHCTCSQYFSSSHNILHKRIPFLFWDFGGSDIPQRI